MKRALFALLAFFVVGSALGQIASRDSHHNSESGMQKVSAQLEVSKPAPQTALNNQYKAAGPVKYGVTERFQISETVMLLYPTLT